MTEQEIIEIERMDGPAAVRAEDAFRLVYAEAFAEPPCNETADDVAATFRRLAERVLLNVHPDSKAAASAYRAWGYRKVGEARPWEGADLHDVMLLYLR
ncbi:hypothetical protein [Streptomyces gossypiisoli]|uniref:hypothetical protein n=1 Tax=Streptomyces gossypiisoli TaxID=2748864 RepID=UPI0015DB2FF4|nr:hypothetical protein [Streptomyces gossypiisoli]